MGTLNLRSGRGDQTREKAQAADRSAHQYGPSSGMRWNLTFESSLFKVRFSRAVSLSFFFFLLHAFITIIFPLRTAFAVSCKFWHVVFLFSFVSRYIFISLLISSLTVQLYVVYIQILVNLPTFLLLLISSFIPLWLEKTVDMILLFWNLLRLILWCKYDQSWRIFYVCLRRMCLLMLLGYVLFILLGQFA